MRLPFLRKATTGGEPLIVAMTGVRLGELVVFSGRSAEWVVTLAARTGLSGRCVVVGPPEATSAIEASASREGVLVETTTNVPTERVFDLVVVEIGEGWEGAADAALRAVRPGGRIITVAGSPRTGLLGRFGGSSPPPVSTDAIVARLTQLGWERARGIGDRDGVSFVEAFAR